MLSSYVFATGMAIITNIVVSLCLIMGGINAWMSFGIGVGFQSILLALYIMLHLLEKIKDTIGEKEC